MLINKYIQKIKLFSGSDKPRMLFFLLIYVKMLTIVGILTFITFFMTSGPFQTLTYSSKTITPESDAYIDATNSILQQIKFCKQAYS